MLGMQGYSTTPNSIPHIGNAGISGWKPPPRVNRDLYEDNNYQYYSQGPHKVIFCYSSSKLEHLFQLIRTKGSLIQVLQLQVSNTDNRTMNC